MLKDRAIFLTGGGTGLGRSMALHFAMLGARMFLVGRREQPLRDVCDEIRRGGGSAAFATCDVRDYGAVETAANLAYEQFGRIDSVINNAAGNFMARTEKLTPNAFNAVIGIVLNGTFNCTQIFGKKWIAEKLGGNVLNIVTSYAAANCGSAFVVPSACAKAGVLAMTTSLAVEWAKHHIRLNAIAPRPFPTDVAWTRQVPYEPDCALGIRAMRLWTFAPERKSRHNYCGKALERSKTRSSACPLDLPPAVPLTTMECGCLPFSSRSGICGDCNSTRK